MRLNRHSGSNLQFSNAGGVRLELIAWESKTGPLASFLLPFSLAALQSRELLTVHQDQVLTYLSATNQDQPQSESHAHDRVSLKSHGIHTPDRCQLASDVLHAHNRGQPGSRGQEHGPVSACATSCDVLGQSDAGLRDLAGPCEHAKDFSAKDGQVTGGGQDSAMTEAQSSDTAWPFVNLHNADWRDSIAMCPPGECFLRITATLIADDEETHRTATAVESCWKQDLREQYAATSSDSIHSACNVKLQKPSHERAPGIIQAAKCCAQQLWSIISATLRFSAMSSSASSSVKQTHHLKSKACIDSLVRSVSAPHKLYMKELHGIPDPHVVESLAAVPSKSEALVFFAEFKDSRIAQPAISMSDFTSLSPRLVEFSISSDVVGAYVLLETSISGKFSHNGMLLLPWEHISVGFLADEPLHVEALQDTLTVLSVSDTSFSM